MSRKDELRAAINDILARLDEEAFAHLAIQLASDRIWPAGLGGFEDRVTIQHLKEHAATYVDLARR